jgi:hypothetical protein
MAPFNNWTVRAIPSIDAKAQFHGGAMLSQQISLLKGNNDQLSENNFIIRNLIEQQSVINNFCNWKRLLELLL